MRFLDTLAPLPRGARLIVYGAGEGGGRLLARLRDERPDIRVRAFLDDFRRAPRDGVPVRPPGELPALAPHADLLLIASAHFRAIGERLAGCAAIAVAAVHPALLFPEHFFTSNDMRDAARPLGAARALLDDPADRDLFDEVVRNRTAAAPESRDPQALHRARAGAPDAGIYLDFIDRETVEVAVDGGALDGADTVRLLDALPALRRLHAFEPQTAAWLGSPHAARLAADPRVRFDPRPLWSGETELPFRADAANPDGARLDPAARDAPILRTATLDGVARERANERIDFLKLDIEGAEAEALAGGARTLARDRPALAVCIYHRKEHLHELPALIARLLPGARHRLGHYSRSFWETVWYSLPDAPPRPPKGVTPG